MKKRRQAPAARIASPDVLAERGAEDLKAERFKEAVEAFRQLVKLEPRPEWLESLAAAYVGRGKVLAAKGMYKEAGMVFDNATAIDGAFHEPLIYLACLVKAGDTGRAARLCSRFLDEDVKGVTAEALPRIADLAAALWLSGDRPPPDSSLAKVHDAAEKALAAWSGGADAEEVDALLAAIPLRSPFKPLRLVLKSLTGTEDPERRRKLLDMIPPDSAFGSLVQAAGLAVGGDLLRTADSWPGLRTSARTFVTEASGLPTDRAKLLIEIAEAERHGPDAVLDTLLRNAGRLEETGLRAACLNLLPKAPKRIGKFERQFGPLSRAERHRIDALAAGLVKHWDAFEDNWLEYALELEKSSDPDAALTRSVIFRHLADTALEVPDIDDPEFEDDPIANWLRLSVEACPDSSEGVLKLIARLREGGHAREAGIWADWAVERFPEDAAVLVEAIEAAAGRRAFAKAADLAARLLKVDPINTLARQRLSDMKIAHARKKMRQGRADLAARELDEAARAERRDSPDGALKIARGFVAIRAGQTEDGWSQVRDGVLMLGNGVAAWLRAVVEGRAMGLTEKELQRAAKELATAMSAVPTGGDIIAALAVLNRREVRDDKRLAAEGLKAIRRWLVKGADCPLTPAEFQTVAETLARAEAFDLLGTYAKAAGRRDPSEPLYDFYRVFARTKGDPLRPTNAEIGVLDEVIQRATERKDVKLAARAVKFLEDGMPGMPYFEGGFGNPFGDPFDDPFGDPLDDPLGGDLLGMPADVLRDVKAAGARTLALLETHSEREAVDILVKEFRDSAMAKMLPKGTLKSLFTTMVEEASGSPDFLPPPRKKRSRRAGR